ncbi:MAG: hypothetical protein HQK72_17570 [Desulfamplus sp.]|nr:hypothetical protein [Desulfamplus sp.]
MAGIQEVLTIGFIIALIFLIPRLSINRPYNFHKKSNISQKMSGNKRLGIVVSIFLPTIMLFAIKPWEGRYIIFILVAILPVALGWAGIWIRDGFKNNNSSE